MKGIQFNYSLMDVGCRRRKDIWRMTLTYQISHLLPRLCFMRAAIKAGRGTKTCANSTPWPPIFCPFRNSEWVQCCSPPLHLGPNMVRSLSWCGQIWRKGQFFFQAMAVFQPIGSLPYMATAWWSYCYCTLMRCSHEDDHNSAGDDDGGKHDIDVL